MRSTRNGRLSGCCNIPVSYTHLRQYAERERTVYSLMCVTETGTELVGDKDAPYFIGALLDGDEPPGGALLDFVRITNLFDTARSGALYLTASDSDSP